MTRERADTAVCGLVLFYDQGVCVCSAMIEQIVQCSGRDKRVREHLPSTCLPVPPARPAATYRLPTWRHSHPSLPGCVMVILTDSGILGRVALKFFMSQRNRRVRWRSHPHRAKVSSYYSHVLVHFSLVLQCQTRLYSPQDDLTCPGSHEKAYPRTISL